MRVEDEVGSVSQALKQAGGVRRRVQGANRVPELAHRLVAVAAPGPRQGDLGRSEPNLAINPPLREQDARVGQGESTAARCSREP